MPRARIEAIRELYAEDAVLLRAACLATGHAAISEAVDALLASLPPNFVFTASAGRRPQRRRAPALAVRTAERPVAVTGTDVARFEGGLIQTLHVFLDPTGA